MTKTLFASVALALTLGMSGSAFAAPGKEPPGDPTGGPHAVATCPAGQAGVVVLGLRDLAKITLGITPGALVNQIIGDQLTPGADDFVQDSHVFCNVGRDNPNPS